MDISKKNISPHNKTTHERLSEKFVGRRFGRLVITEVVGKFKYNHTAVKAICDCGGHIFTEASAIKRGKARSCGCLKIEASKTRNGSEEKVKHGEARKNGRTKEYRTWLHLRRIFIKSNGESSEVCERWQGLKEGYMNFLEDMGRRPEGKFILKRIDKTKAYCKENCVWLVKKNKAI